MNVMFVIVFFGFAKVSSFCDFWFCDPDVTWSVDMGEFGLRIWIFHVAGAAFHILTLQG